MAGEVTDAGSGSHGLPLSKLHGEDKAPGPRPASVTCDPQCRYTPLLEDLGDLPLPSLNSSSSASPEEKQPRTTWRASMRVAAVASALFLAIFAGVAFLQAAQPPVGNVRANVQAWEGGLGGADTFAVGKGIGSDAVDNFEEEGGLSGADGINDMFPEIASELNVARFAETPAPTSAPFQTYSPSPPSDGGDQGTDGASSGWLGVPSPASSPATTSFSQPASNAVARTGSASDSNTAAAPWWSPSPPAEKPYSQASALGSGVTSISSSLPPASPTSSPLPPSAPPVLPEPVASMPMSIQGSAIASTQPSQSSLSQSTHRSTAAATTLSLLSTPTTTSPTRLIRLPSATPTPRIVPAATPMAATTKEFRTPLFPTSTRTTRTTTTTMGTTRTTTTTTAAPTLFCFALMMPEGYEVSLMRTLLERGRSIFACDKYAVFSSKDVELSPGPPVRIGTEDIGSVQCKYGGKFNLAMNSEIFVRVWKRVFEDGAFNNTDWSVKVDPDAVFLPQRLRQQVRESDPRANVYLNNCDQGLHGPIEVLAWGGMQTFKKGIGKCVEKLSWEFDTQGEDVFLRHCLGLLKINRVDNFRLLSEMVCMWENPIKDGCVSGKVAFHPFKHPEEYFDCLHQAER